MIFFFATHGAPLPTPLFFFFFFFFLLSVRGGQLRQSSFPRSGPLHLFGVRIVSLFRRRNKCDPPLRAPFQEAVLSYLFFSP